MKPFITIKELKLLLAEKKITPSEVAHHYRERINKYNKDLNAVIEIFDDPIPEMSNGALAGIPCIIKDLICQKGKKTTAGSKILSNYTAPYDATVMTRLKKAGAFSLGRSNMDEFAMGASGEYSAYGAVHSPWDHSRTPGGSSSGPAASVAAGLAPFAIGTETGGSIRQPASFCNLVGLYPTYGLHSRYGIIAFASSLDQPGPLTRTVYDNALVTSVLSGQDPHDSTTLALKPQDYTQGLDGKLPENFTLGILKESVESDGIDPQVRATFMTSVEQFKKLGAKITYIDIPHLKYGIAVYFILSRAEGASNLSRYDGTLYGARAPECDNLLDMYIKTRQDGFLQEVKTRILTGNFVLSSGHKDAYYNQANKVRSIIRAQFEDAFKSVDLLISPTVSTLPFKLGEFVGDPVSMFLADYYTVPSCVIGTPGLAFPAGFSKEGLPIGIQLMGPRLSEKLLYKVAHAFEQSTDYHLKHPALYE